MKDFIHSQTYQNLEKAFINECEAYTKYQFYASQAKKDNYMQIHDIFNETANNEREHAKIWYQLLHDGKIDLTINNLIDSVELEHAEASFLYRNYAEQAYQEGYKKIGDLFMQIADIEKNHCNRFNILFNNVRKDKVFHKDDIITWKCNNCGYVHIDRDAPQKCPVCEHPQYCFEEQLFNYL